MTYALAGQPGPLCRRVGGRVVELATPAHRLPVGALREASWDLVSECLRPGDMLVIYSDGLTDAQNRQGDSFGEERLQMALARFEGSAADCLDRLLAEVERFADGDEPYDDITVLVARRTADRGLGMSDVVDA